MTTVASYIETEEDDFINYLYFYVYEIFINQNYSPVERIF